MYSEPDDEPTKKLLKAIINAAIFLGVIIFATFLLMCFFYFKCYTVRSCFEKITFLLKITPNALTTSKFGILDGLDIHSP